MRQLHTCDACTLTSDALLVGHGSRKQDDSRQPVGVEATSAACTHVTPAHLPRMPVGPRMAAGGRRIAEPVVLEATSAACTNISGPHTPGLMTHTLLSIHHGSLELTHPCNPCTPTLDALLVKPRMVAEGRTTTDSLLSWNPHEQHAPAACM